MLLASHDGLEVLCSGVASDREIVPRFACYLLDVLVGCVDPLVSAYWFTNRDALSHLDAVLL